MGDTVTSVPGKLLGSFSIWKLLPLYQKKSYNFIPFSNFYTVPKVYLTDTKDTPESTGISGCIKGEVPFAGIS